MNRGFTILLTGFIVLTINFSCIAQTTWVRTLNKDVWYHSSLTIDSTHVGPFEISITPDGTILAMTQIDPDHNTGIFALDSLGNVIWEKNVGFYYTSQTDDCFSMHSTLDNGCSYILRHYNWGSDIRITIFRLDSILSYRWSQDFIVHLGINDPVNVTLIPTHFNTFLFQYSDSLTEFNDLGDVIRIRSPFNGIIKTLPDSDFILTVSDSIIRENFNGIQTWGISTPGFSVESANMFFIYARSGSQVMKINTLNGNIIWTDSINSNSLSTTSDDGFISVYDNNVAKYDSGGNLQWTKAFSFPEFGFKKVCEVNSKTYVTGGCWNNIYLIQPSTKCFSPFLTLIDSSGNGVIDSTDFFFYGNANDNNEVTFGDDAVYVAAAMNNFGSARDVNGTSYESESVYCTEWNNRFSTGLNHKYSDFNGDGLIDTADISGLYNISPIGSYNAKPHWYKVAQPLNFPELTFAFENDTINYTDTIKLNIILGSQSTPIDSIYGLSFDLSFNYIHASAGINTFYSIKPSTLGDTSANLYVYHSFHPQGVPFINSMVLCRTDHTNAYVAGDTIATLYFNFPPSATFINPITVYANWSAITEGGFPVSLNVVSDTLTLFSTVGINNLNQNEIKIFPNPANEQIMFSLKDENIKELSIMDETGRKIITINDPGNKYLLNVKDFAEGIYYVSILSSNRITRSKFLVVH